MAENNSFADSKEKTIDIEHYSNKRATPTVSEIFCVAKNHTVQVLFSSTAAIAVMRNYPITN